MLIKNIVAAAIIVGIASFNIAGPVPQASAASCTSSTFRNGSTGTCVRYIQTILNTCATKVGNCYYNLTPYGAQLVVDGAYGAKTTSTVKVFQQYYGMGSLTVDGVVGPKTWSKLCTSMSYGVTWYGDAVWKSGVDAARAAGCAI